MCFSARASSSLVYEWNTHRMKRVFSAPWCSSFLILGLNKTSAHATDLDYPVSLTLSLYLFLKTSMRTHLPEQVRGWTYVILKVCVGGRPRPPCDLRSWGSNHNCLQYNTSHSSNQLTGCVTSKLCPGWICEKGNSRWSMNKRHLALSTNTFNRRLTRGTTI